jgi:hypothetical protein
LYSEFIQIALKLLNRQHVTVQDKFLAEVYGMSKHSALTINGQIYRGDMTGYDVFKAICSGFQSKTRPKECDQNYDL